MEYTPELLEWLGMLNISALMDGINKPVA